MLFRSPQNVRADAWPGGQRDNWPSRPGQTQHEWEPPRIVGNASTAQRRPNDLGFSEQAEQASDSVAASSAVMGNASHKGHAGAEGQGGPGAQGQPNGHAAQSIRCEAQPTLGGNANGPSCGLDYAQLCVSGDNRTDELRLLGNGVVPATAERAFRTLMERLL